MRNEINFYFCLMQYWLIKSEPFAYSWEQLKKDKNTGWEGVRNYAARNNLRSMKKGDLAFFYHSMEGHEIKGVAKIIRESYQDPGDDNPAWLAVDIAAHKEFKKPVTLEQIKKEPALKGMELLRITRLSVSKVTEKEFEHLCAMGGI
jgi:predicted RNA-binding protein with PUA-like domain